jgi:hypothetical protein
MQPLIRIAQLGLLLGAACAALAADGPAALSAQDQTAAFNAAGAAQTKGMWTMCADDPNTTGARIESASDVNGDGLPDAVIAEDGTFCYGMAGMGYAIVSKQASGEWRLMSQGAGIPSFLAARGAQGWPDLQIGGPGFCFPVERWDGTAYALHRHEYEGKACAPPQ